MDEFVQVIPEVTSLSDLTEMLVELSGLEFSKLAPNVCHPCDLHAPLVTQSML